MTMPSRSYEAQSSYRYGFNGKEKDNDINLGAVAFEARIYDARIGRFFSTDPREAEYAWQSTYVYFKNSPVSVLDIKGMGGEEPPPDDEESSYNSGKGSCAATLQGTDNGGCNPTPSNGGSSTRDNPNIIGTAAHQTLSLWLALRNLSIGRNKYRTNESLSISRLRPDIVDVENKNVWELKPESHDPRFNKGKMGKFNKASRQLDNYVDLINQGELVGFPEGGFSKGSDKWSEMPLTYNYMMLPGIVNGNPYIFTYYIRDINSGIIFYQSFPLTPPPVLSPVTKPEYKPSPVVPIPVYIPSFERYRPRIPLLPPQPVTSPRLYWTPPRPNALQPGQVQININPAHVATAIIGGAVIIGSWGTATPVVAGALAF